MHKQTNSASRLRGGSAEMVSVALPMVVSLSCDTVMVFSSRWLLASLGEDILNAAFAGGLAAFVVQTFFVGLISYTTALVAQAYGAGQPARCRPAAVQAMWLALFAWPLILLSIPMAHYLFPRLGLPAAQIGPQLVFYDLLVAGSVLGLIRGAFSGFFSGLGRTRIVMTASLVAMISNGFFVWTLAFGHLGFPALGIAGAGIASLCASATGLSVLLYAWLKTRFVAEKDRVLPWRIDKPLMRELLRKGMPSGIELFLNMLAFQCLVLLFQRQGAHSATAATVMFNWDMVSFVPLIGIEVSTMSLVGRYIGAQDPAAVRRTLGSGIKLGLSFSAIVLIAFLIFPGALVDIFRPDLPSDSFEQARGIAISMIRVASLYLGTNALLLVFAGALRGSGDTFWAMCATVGMHWLMVPTLWFALEVLHLGTVKAWIILIALFIFYPLVLGLRWRSGHWRTLMAQCKQVTAPVAYEYAPRKDDSRAA